MNEHNKRMQPDLFAGYAVKKSKLNNLTIVLLVTLTGCAEMQAQREQQQAQEPAAKAEQERVYSMLIGNYGDCLKKHWQEAIHSGANATNSYNYGLSNCTFEQQLLCDFSGTSTCYQEVRQFTRLMFLQFQSGQN